MQEGRLFQAAVLTLLGGLYVFGPRPPDRELYGGIEWDHVSHTLAFAVGTLLCLAAAVRTRQFIGVAALMVGCALGLELLQAVVTLREYSMEDVFANLLGTAVSLPIGWKRLRRRRASS